MNSIGMWLAASIWGTWVLVLSNVKNVPGFYVTAFTSLSGFFALFIYILFTKQVKGLKQIFTFKNLLKIIFVVALFEGLQNALFMITLTTTAREGGSIYIPIIRSLSGIITPIITIFFTGIEKFNRKYLLYGFISVIGATIIILGNGNQSSQNISIIMVILAFSSVIISSLQSLYQKKLANQMKENQQSEINVITIQVFFTFLILLPFIIYHLHGNATEASSFIYPILFISIFGITHVALAFILRLNALRYISAQQSVLIAYIEPTLSVFFSILFLHEKASLNFAFGAILILLSSVSANLQSTKRTALVSKFRAE